MKIPVRHVAGLVALCALLVVVPLAAYAALPVLHVAKDGFPSGHATPEGAACDLARAFMHHDIAVFQKTCIALPQNKGYNGFLKSVVQSMRDEAKKSIPSPQGPKQIAKLFAARNLSHGGPASYGYAVFGFKDVKFVDTGMTLQNGNHAMYRLLVIQDANGNWYVDPAPAASPLLSEGLNNEAASTKDFQEAYTIRPL